MYIVAIDEDLCSGCNSCTAGCPARLLEFNGDKAVVTGDETECMGCESCTTVCPSGAVSITEM